MIPSPRHIAVALLLAWLASAFAAFAWLHDELRQPFAEGEQIAFFEGERFRGWLEALAAAPGDERPALLLFRDPACPCAFANDLHLRDILRRYGDRVAAVLAQPAAAAAPGWLPEGVRVAAATPPTALPVPAAAVLRPGGELAYFGPFSLGADCSAQAGFVETALDTVLRGDRIQATSTIGTGCFCTRETTL